MGEVDDAYQRGYADGFKAAEEAAKERVRRRIATAKERLAQWGGHWGRPKRLTDEDIARAKQLREKGHSIRQRGSDAKGATVNGSSITRQGEAGWSADSNRMR